MAMRSMLAVDGRASVCTQSNGEKGRALVPKMPRGGVRKKTMQCTGRLLQIQNGERFQDNRMECECRAAVSSLFQRQETTKMGLSQLFRMWRTEAQQGVPECRREVHFNEEPESIAMRRVRQQAQAQGRRSRTTANDRDDHTTTN